MVEITNIIFDTIELNIGGGLDVEGKFTAPFSGIYYITFGNRAGSVPEISLYVDATVYLRTVSAYTSAYGGVVQLNQGSVVYPAVKADDSDWISCSAGGQDCYFSGFLIHEVV